MLSYIIKKNSILVVKSTLKEMRTPVLEVNTDVCVLWS